MNALIGQVYQALLPLQVAVTRGFPQAIVPLPSISIEEKDNRVERDGEQVQALQVSIRAASPEQADDLCAQADAVLSAMGLRRAACRDGAEKDSGSYLKATAYERRLAAGAAEAPEAMLQLGTQQFEAALVSWEREAALVDARSLGDRMPRLAGERLGKATLTLRLDVRALAAVREAPGQAAQVTLGTTAPLTCMLRGFRLRGGTLEVSLDETLV